MARLGERDGEPAYGSSLSPPLGGAFRELKRVLDEDDPAEKVYHLWMALQYLAVLSEQAK